MTHSTVAEARAVLERDPEEREVRGTTPGDVRDALLDVIDRGSKEEKVVEGCTLPALDLEYETIDGANRHPVVFRDCDVAAIRAEHADVRLPVRFEGCEVGSLAVEGARFEYDVVVEGTTIGGPVDAFEARFDRDADFAGSTFADPVSMDEATFADDASFAGATFEDEASFRAAAFHGASNELGDNADFSGASFEGSADLRQATFEAADFATATFAGEAGLEEVRFADDADFDDATFDGPVDFDEARFGGDASFGGVAFRGEAVFRGAEFEGGARSLHDDASFAEATFAAGANFRFARFRYVNYGEATFGGRAMFEEARFEADVDFLDVAFEDEADFDEARFDGDADFSGSTFEGPAVFRGAAFEGEARHAERNATFDEVRFSDDADFDDASFTTASFEAARFGGVVDFSGAAFEDDVALRAESGGGDTYVDLTGAVLKAGTITQPDGEWVRYDFTSASVGDVTIEATGDGGRHELLDYFRFCDTEFNEFDGYEFDFSAHTYYLDRNEWALHTFEEPPGGREHAMAMTPENVETTYLRAKNAASEGGYVKAAGEFRVQRQRHARRKHLAIARDRSLDAGVRARNFARAAENYFLDLTCGYGMRLGRIMAVFLVAPLFPALLYTFGGRPFLTGAGQLSSLSTLATPAGQASLYQNLHSSYITFLTIGYGGIGPQGALARLLAGLEVYLSVVLGGLVLYALIKRSEL